MGYACPVCGDPQADAGHLANHLAFTAILGEDDHEAWLDEYAAGWGEMGEAELADVVVDHVEETEFPQVFEDTVGGLEASATDSLAERSGMLFDDEGFLEDDGSGHGDGPGHEHGDGPGHGHGDARGADHGHGDDAGRDDDQRRRPPRSGNRSGEMDAETEAILAEAREMTEAMLEDADRIDGDGAGDGEGDTGGDGETQPRGRGDADENA